MRSGLELAGRYRLEALLGRGGMGEVWRGVDGRLGRPVAVKLLAMPEGTDGRLVHRFRREVEISAGLRHPNIVVVHDGGEEEGLLFLVMELLDGDDLAAVIRRHPDGLPVERALPIAAQVADALGAAHGRGVVHRDVKPANVMLLPGDRVTVMDFGIARHADQVTELTGSAVIGTPAYMAPEQFERGDVGAAADVYALGALLFALLTGRTPFTADTLPVLIRSIVLEPAPRLRSLRPELPDSLDRLVDAMLAKNPADRPADARTAAELIRTALASPPPPASAPAVFPPPVPGGTRVETVAGVENGAAANTYVVGDDDEVFVIDPAHRLDGVHRVVGRRDIVAVILTDGEPVHVQNARNVSAGAYVALPRAALAGWRAHYERLSTQVMEPGRRKELRKHRPDTLFKREEEFEIGDVRLTAIDVPSPYRGSVWLYGEELNVLFTGFTLQTPDPRHRYEQGALLARLPPATRVLPGWGGETTVGALLAPPRRS
ncbi:protein kinase domain-containing protein [Actinomadura rifamycini]|uniref:protein kinase domain-containing protein n=1 Tax=Actinomadura rifamycini TaxID=31962 RepID=UPI000408BE89|nr:protein kinase [Actinomadura rifamycini]